jgi:hypothetical protein
MNSEEEMLAWLRVHGLKPGTIKGPGRQSRSSPERRLNPPPPHKNTKPQATSPFHSTVRLSDPSKQIIGDRFVL